jgi:ABC-2 type transport system permease protein
MKSDGESRAGKVWRNLRTIASLTYYLGLLPAIRIPALLPFVFSTPFTILFILFVTGHGSAFAFGISGAITMTVSQQGLFLGADLTNFKIEHKFQSMVVSSPVSALTYMFSMAISELAFATPPIVLLLMITSYSLSGITALSILEVLAVILLTWVTTSSIGFFLSTYVLNTRTAFLTVSFISILLSILPPVFYPLQVIPVQFRWLAQLAPTTHSSVLIQTALGLGAAGGQVTDSWLALPFFAVVFLLLALFKARWREN